MTKAVCVSDTHIKFGAPFTRMTASGIDTRIKEVIDSMLWAAEQGVTEGCDMYICSGDMFDVPAKLPTQEGLYIADAFRRINGMFKHGMIAIVGNHDMISNSESILRLYSDTITVISAPTSITMKGFKLSFLPYQRDKETLIAEFKKLAGAGSIDPHYCFSHFWLKSEVANDPEAPELTELPYDKFTKIFTGHLHAPTKQSFVKDAPVIYLGSLANHSFADTGKKGAWIVDFKNQTYNFVVNPHSPEFFKTTDTQIRMLHDEGLLIKNAYYRVECDPVNILEITGILSNEVNGFEVVNKEDKTQASAAVDVSIVTTEKKNAQTLKQYILSNALTYKPDVASDDEFIALGEELLKGI